MLDLPQLLLKLRFLFGLCHNQLKELPWWISGKESICNAGDIGDTGSISRSGRSLGRGNYKPLQYTCLGNPMDRGAWWVTVQGAAKSWTQPSTAQHSAYQLNQRAQAWVLKKSPQMLLKCNQGWETAEMSRVSKLTDGEVSLLRLTQTLSSDSRPTTRLPSDAWLPIRKCMDLLMWVFLSVLRIKLALKIALSFCELISWLLVYVSVIVIFVNVGLRYVSNLKDVAPLKCHKHQGSEPVRMLDPGNVPVCENESRWPADLS